MTRGEAKVGDVGEQVDLTAQVQQRLLALDLARASADHYTLLGVSRAADAKQIRDAYYEVVHQLHPDRFFGKRLGSFEPILTRVFARFTEAYEVLHQPAARNEYDRYLRARERTQEFDRHLRETSPPVSGERPVPSASGEHLSVRPPPDSNGALPASGYSSTSSFPPSGPALRPSMMPASDPEERRRALARKLGHSSAPPPRRPSSQAPAVGAANASAAAADELKRRYEQRLAQARDEQRNHYIAQSREATTRKDLVAAANYMRIALSLDPQNLELAGDLAELERSAAANLWEDYLERAKYAALDGNLAEAAECYERAALGQPSAALFERAAHFTLEAQGDLRKAAKLAKQAVALAPNAARCHLTLAQVYAAANLRESALASLERARALEPNQPIIKDWIARVKRGET